MTALNARIIHLHSATQGAVPTAEQLGAIGVLAINAADGCDNAAPKALTQRSRRRPQALIASDFSMPTGSDIHEASQWQIASDQAFKEIVHDSGNSQQLTSYAIPAGTLKNIALYWFRVRFKGKATGYGGGSLDGKGFGGDKHPAWSPAYTAIAGIAFGKGEGGGS